MRVGVIIIKRSVNPHKIPNIKQLTAIAYCLQHTNIHTHTYITYLVLYYIIRKITVYSLLKFKESTIRPTYFKYILLLNGHE